jgi:HPt (histidine-containing phosphotransfer) domain-containing protein
MTKPTESSCIVDGDALERLRDDVGTSAFARFIRDFARVSQQRLLELQQALETRDRDALADAAHALRGGAAYLGVHPVVELCAQLEDCAETGDLHQVREALVEMERMLMDAREVLTAHLTA